MNTEPAGENTREGVPYWIAFAAVAGVVAASIFFQAIVIAIGSALGASASHPTPAMNNANNFLLDLAFLGSALYFTTVSGFKGRFVFGYRRIPWKIGVLAVIAGGAAYYGVTLVYSAVLNLHATDRLPSGLGMRHTGWAITVAVYVCVVAPIVEEFFFRGFLFGVLRRMKVTVAGHEMGPWMAAVIVGILFGLAHIGGAKLEFLPPLAFLGFVLCIMRWRTGSLYPCMALHSLNNSIALSVNQHLGWGAGEITALIVGSLAVIALVTGPLSASRPEPVASV